MQQNPITVRIAGKSASLITDLAKETGRSPDELVADAIDSAFRDRRPPYRIGSELTPKQQKENLRKLFEELDRLPVNNPDGDCAGRDHDKYLYGWDKS